MKRLILTLMLGVVFLNTHLYAKQMRVLTFYGKMDKRLYASIISIYRSMNPDDMRKNYKECTRTDWNTNGARRTLTYDIVEVIPNKKGTYKVTIPIDYVGKDKCGWEYVATEIRVSRDKKDEKDINTIVLASMSNRVDSDNSRASGGVGLYSPGTTKKHFLLSSGSKIECYTEHFEISKYFKKPHTIFICPPKPFDNVNGVDKLKTANINIDIVVNKNKSRVVNDGISDKKKDYFRDYKEPINRFKQLELDIKNFIKNIFK